MYQGGISTQAARRHEGRRRNQFAGTRQGAAGRVKFTILASSPALLCPLISHSRQWAFSIVIVNQRPMAPPIWFRRFFTFYDTSLISILFFVECGKTTFLVIVCSLHVLNRLVVICQLKICATKQHKQCRIRVLLPNRRKYKYSVGRFYVTR